MAEVNQPSNRRSRELKQSSSTQSIYKPLNSDKREIRILYVKPSINSEDVPDVTLQTVSLYSEPKPEYESVSYCWQEVPGLSQIRLNGTIVDAPASAIKVLRRLRLENEPRSLWIDAMCINQADLDERAAQVQLMSQVYQNATQCLIWLGDGTSKTDMLMDCIRYISETLYEELSQATSGFSQFQTPPPSSFKYKATHPFRDNDLDPQDLIDFYGQLWFSRVWVLQEAVLPPHAVCYIGTCQIAWQDVRRVGQWIMEELDRKPSNLFTGCVCDCWMRTLGALMFVRAAARFTNQPTNWYTPVLNLNAYLGATDDRDRFYGTLGLVFSKHTPASELSWLHVNYTTSVPEVYRAATRTAIIVERYLYILSAVEGLDPLERDLADPKSCSWARPLDAPPVSDVPERNIRPDFHSRKNCADRPMNMDAIISFNDEKYLSLSGYAVSRVSTVLTTCMLRFEGPDTSLRAMLQKIVDGLAMSGRKDLVRHMIAAVVGDKAELPDIDTDDGWMEFAKRLASHQRPGLSAEQFPIETKGPSSEIDCFLEAGFEAAYYSCQGRRFFLTTDGRIGLGHESVQDGDYVVVLFGSMDPCILRTILQDAPSHAQRENDGSYGGEDDIYRFIGLAYVPGIMDGEAVEAFEGEAIEPQIYCLW